MRHPKKPIEMGGKAGHRYRRMNLRIGSPCYSFCPEEQKNFQYRRKIRLISIVKICIQVTVTVKRGCSVDTYRLLVWYCSSSRGTDNRKKFKIDWRLLLCLREQLPLVTSESYFTITDTQQSEIEPIDRERDTPTSDDLPKTTTRTPGRNHFNYGTIYLYSNGRLPISAERVRELRTERSHPN